MYLVAQQRKLEQLNNNVFSLLGINKLTGYLSLKILGAYSRGRQLDIFKYEKLTKLKICL